MVFNPVNEIRPSDSENNKTSVTTGPGTKQNINNKVFYKVEQNTLKYL